MSNKQHPKILSPEAFEKAVRPMIEEAAAAAYLEGFQAGYERAKHELADDKK